MTLGQETRWQYFTNPGRIRRRVTRGRINRKLYPQQQKKTTKNNNDDRISATTTTTYLVTPTLDVDFDQQLQSHTMRVTAPTVCPALINAFSFKNSKPIQSQ